MKAIAYRQLMHVVKQKGHLLVDWFVYPLVMVVSFGLLVKTLAPDQVTYVLLAAILWRVAATFQTSVVVGFMEDVWHDTMRQTWSLPIRLRDYVLGNMVFGAVSSLFTLGVTLGFAWMLFGVTPPAEFVASYLVLVSFGAVLGLFGMAALLRWGEGMQPMNWVIMDIVVLASGVFYPLGVLPLPVRFVAHFLPTTYVFLGLREASYEFFAVGAVLVACYMVLVWYALKAQLRHAKAEGKLVKFC